MRIRIAGVLAGALGCLLCGAVAGHAQVQPCEGSDCAQVSVGGVSGSVSRGATVQIPVSFTQGGGAGIGEIAAVAFSMKIPGLELADCSSPDANGLTSAVSVPPSIADGYRVVIENTANCEGSTKPCLCPGDGQTRADYVNIVVFGPKDLPTPGSGTVDIPLLSNGELLTLALKVSNSASGTLTLHVVNETDNQGTQPKPQFGAFLSVGDKNAVDQTVDRGASVSKVKVADGTVTVSGAPACVGDCNGDNEVFGNEITKAINIVAGTADLSTCEAADANGDGEVFGNEVTIGINNLANGCPQ